MDTRQNELTQWITEVCPDAPFTMNPLPGDASFRRYFRVEFSDHTAIAMDAPPECEDSYPFVTIARALRKLDLHVPDIIQENLSQGFLLLSDLGDELYLKKLTADTADQLYGKALKTLLTLQTCTGIPGWGLPNFDRRMIGQELDLFSEWFLDRYLNLHLTQKESHTLRSAFDLLLTSAEEQPQVCVHRDYHSRNLMVFEDQVGILDFQDAVWGPISYDVVSLLRDCYIDWPKERVHTWALSYFEQAQAANIMPPDIKPSQFMRWFDLMGVQRHLKASFIFVRKLLRDHDRGYLDDIPRTLHYIEQVLPHYPEFKKFNELLIHVILPKFYEVYRR